MTKRPLFIHINSSGGKYIKSKLCEKYNNLIKFLKPISVIRLNKINELSNLLNFNSPLVYKSKYKNDDNNKSVNY